MVGGTSGDLAQLGVGHTGGHCDGVGGDGWPARLGFGSAAREERNHCFPASAAGKLGCPHSGNLDIQWGDWEQGSQGPCIPNISYNSPGKRRRQQRTRKWKKWVERRRYRRRRRQRTIATARASQDQHQTGGKYSVKVTPSWERPPTVFGPLGVGYSVPLWDLCITETRLHKIQIRPKRDKRLLWNQLLRGSIPRIPKFVITCC